MTSQNQIRSIKRTFDIVETLVDIPYQGVSRIAEETGLPKSTVHSHLSTLQDLGFVQKDGTRYATTAKFLDLGGRHRRSLEIYKQSRQAVDELAMETEGYADLYIEENGLGVLLHLSTGGADVELGFAYEGLHHPLHTNASGKSILAFLSEQRVAEIIEHYQDLPLDAPLDEDELLNELRTIQQQKYVIDQEEALIGMSGVGAPILNRQGEAEAGIAVYKPAYEMSDEYLYDELPKLVQQKANVIEVNLNYSQ